MKFLGIALCMFLALGLLGNTIIKEKSDGDKIASAVIYSLLLFYMIWSLITIF